MSPSYQAGLDAARADMGRGLTPCQMQRTGLLAPRPGLAPAFAAGYTVGLLEAAERCICQGHDEVVCRLLCPACGGL